MNPQKVTAPSQGGGRGFVSVLLACVSSWRSFTVTKVPDPAAARASISSKESARLSFESESCSSRTKPFLRSHLATRTATVSTSSHRSSLVKGRAGQNWGAPSSRPHGLTSGSLCLRCGSTLLVWSLDCRWIRSSRVVVMVVTCGPWWCLATMRCWCWVRLDGGVVVGSWCSFGACFVG